MVNYKCLRCGYSNNIKTKFIKHLNRKHICKPKLKDISRKKIHDFYFKPTTVETDTVKEQNSILDEMTGKTDEKGMKTDEKRMKTDETGMKTDGKNGRVECKYCKKTFLKKEYLNKHLKKYCKEKKIYEEEEKQEKEHKEDLLKLVKLMNKKMNSLEKQLKKRDKQLLELQKKTGVTIGQQNNIQNNIKILAFNKTDMSHLKDKDYLKFLSHSNFCVPHMIKKLHFDPHKPENHNIYISNIKNNYVMIYDGKKWKLEDQKNVIDNMLDNSTFILEDKIEDWIKNGKKYPEIMEKFNRYIEKKENDEVLNKIKQEIKLILFNNRTLVLKDK